jgi:lipoprotein-releasing system permease protein
MGYSQKDISKIFFTTGFSICICGVVFGNVFGILLAKNIDNIKNFVEHSFGVQIFDSAFYFLSYLPSIVEFRDILFINLFCLVLIILSIKKSLKDLKSINPSILLK